MDVLVITAGRFKEARFPLASQAVIGRSAECDIRLPDGSISRRHARVDRLGEDRAVTDLGSLNGTFVNGERLEGPRTLKDGDTVGIGDAELTFRRGVEEIEYVATELGQRHRRYLDALCRFQAQVANVENWETVVAILCQTIARLLGGESKAQVIQEVHGNFLAYLPAGIEETLLPLPAKEVVQRALDADGPFRVSAGSAIMPFELNHRVPARGIYMVSREITGPDLEMVQFAAQVAGQTRAFNPEGGSIRTMVLNPSALDRIVGKSEALSVAVNAIVRAAPSSVPVLILGESGTGKELVARAIHDLGHRAKRPFVAFNCAGFAPELIDSELFGHERGAFTGATRQHRGLFEQAESGTLLLDEVGELPLPAQAKLLRTLDTGEFRRVGGSDALQAKSRILCATNRNLDEMVEEGRFRLDLYYRVAGFVIDVPPLRKRREDIPDLLRHFLERHAAETNAAPPTFSENALSHLMSHDWPGNVRELEMLVKRLVYASGTKVIGPDDLPFQGRPPNAEKTDLLTLKDLERRHILSVLESCGGNKSQAADILGISRVTLYQKLRGYAEGAEYKDQD